MKLKIIRERFEPISSMQVKNHAIAPWVPNVQDDTKSDETVHLRNALTAGYQIKVAKCYNDLGEESWCQLNCFLYAFKCGFSSKKLRNFAKTCPFRKKYK